MNKRNANKILFLMFEGIEPTIFGSQVAIHARELKKHNIELEIWVFETNLKKYKRSLSNLQDAKELSQSEVKLFKGVYVYLPFSDFLNSLLLLYYLKKHKPDVKFIHARADYSASVGGYIRKLVNLPVIWDCRGDSVSEFDFALTPKNTIMQLAKRILLQVIRWHTYHAAKTCSRANFVSKSLFERKSKYLKTAEVEITPCSVSNQLFYFDEEIRDKMRNELQLVKTDLVLIYSGGMVKYQGFPQYVSMLSQLINKNKNYKFLVLTPYLEKAKEHLSLLPSENYILRSAKLDEMNAYYNAADFGCLLREKNKVNEVASPTKFGEYCLSGLPVIMNNGVLQSYEYAAKIDNLIDYSSVLEGSEFGKKSNSERMSISQRGSELLSREILVENYIRLYR